MSREEYGRYLASREWAVLKRQVRERSRGKCEHCIRGPYQETHHTTYARIGHERVEDLLAVCSPCHRFLSAKSDFDPAWAYVEELMAQMTHYFAERRRIDAELAECNARLAANRADLLALEMEMAQAEDERRDIERNWEWKLERRAYVSVVLETWMVRLERGDEPTDEEVMAWVGKFLSALSDAGMDHNALFDAMKAAA